MLRLKLNHRGKFCCLFLFIYHFDAGLDPAFAPLMRIRRMCDPDPIFKFDADPDSTTHFFPDLDPPMLQNDPLLPPFHSDADPDPAFHFKADPDPDPAFHLKAYPDPDPALDPAFYFDGGSGSSFPF